MLTINHEQTVDLEITEENVNKTKSNENLSKTLLAINRAYQEVLQEKLDKLNKLLKINVEQQHEIIQKISNRNLNQNNNQNHKQDFFKFENELNKIKGNYFKDRFQSEPDDNIDTLKRNKLVYYDYIPQLKSEWTIEVRKKLKQAVLNDSLRIIKNPFINKIKFFEEKILNLTMSDEDRHMELSSVRKMLHDCKNQIKKIDGLSEDKILEQIDSEKIDWFKISNVDLAGNWSSTECYLVWVNVCQPKINQTKWTNKENSMLIELARRFKERNWERIAILLNTGRSAFLCMKRYHEKTAEKYCKRDWTEEESKELIELAEKHRQGLFVPYNYLCYLFGTRDRNSVYNYHLKIDPNLNHGRWTQAEDQAFEEAIQYFSTQNWQDISEYVGTRTVFQCKERFELKFMNPDKYKFWTLEEDKKLLDLVDEYGGQWAKIAASEFPSRTDHSLLFRYNKLMNWRRQNEWFESQQDEIKEFILFLFKKRKANNTEKEDVVMLTEKGEVVPTCPKFGPGTGFLSSIIDKIYEKKDLVIEFVHKKRDGQLSLTLLAKIGIYTPILNNLISKYKKLNLRQAQEQETGKKKSKEKKADITKKIKLKRKSEKQRPKNILIEYQKNPELYEQYTLLHSPEADINPVKVIESKEKKIESQRIKRKYIKRQLISTMVQTSNETNLNQDANDNENNNINFYLRQQNSNQKSKTIKNSIYLSQIDSNGDVNNLINSISKFKKADKIKLNEKNSSAIGKLKISQILDFIQLKNSQYSSFEEAISSKRHVLIEMTDVSTTNPNISANQSITSESDVNKENFAKKSNSKKRKSEMISTESEEPKPKRKYKPREKKIKEPKQTISKKEKIVTKKDSNISTVEKQVNKTPVIKNTSLSQIGSVYKKLTDKNPLIVDFDSIEDGKKIPCLSEHPNEFKYLYSLKKDKDPKFFTKFIVIDCRGSLVAIKPLNGIVNNEYLNELRLNAIEKALKKVFLLK